MPLVLADRVKETTTTVGTGTVTLAGAATGFQSFAVIGNGNTTYYTIAGQGTSEWEVGIGTYTSSGTTLSRDTVLASSAGAPNKTSFSSGTKDVFVTYTAARSVNVDGTSIDTFGMGATQGDILYASATDNFVRLAKDTNATRYLANTGSSNNPAWGQVNLANGVTGTLAVGNGGTGLTVLGTGVVTALGNAANGTGGFTTINGTATLTNKRIDPRTSTATSTASLTPDISSFDQYNLTAQAATLAINAPTGTPVDGNKLIFRILDNGVSQTLNWNGTYTAIGSVLPTATVAGKMTYVGCIYNSTNTRWDVLAAVTQP